MTNRTEVMEGYKGFFAGWMTQVQERHQLGQVELEELVWKVLNRLAETALDDYKGAKDATDIKSK